MKKDITLGPYVSVMETRPCIVIIFNGVFKFRPLNQHFCVSVLKS